MPEEPEHADAPGGAYIYFSVGDQRGDEFVAVPEMIPPPGRLIAAIKFMRQVVGVEGI